MSFGVLLLLSLTILLPSGDARAATDQVPARLKCGEYGFRGRLRSSADGRAMLHLQGTAAKRVPLAVSGLTPDELARHAGQFVEVRARVDSEAAPEHVEASITRVVGIVPRAKALERPTLFLRKVACLPPRPSARPAKEPPPSTQRPRKATSSPR